MSSARILTGPSPRRARLPTNCVAKRVSESSRSRSSASSSALISETAKPRARSFCSSSRRLCSRLASNPRLIRRTASRGVSPGRSDLFFLNGRFRVFRRTAAARFQQPGADLLLDLGGDIGVLDQPLADIVLALADAIAIVAVPGAGLLDDVLADAELDQLALAGDALAVENLEIGFLERRCDLVLHHLHAGLVAEDLVALLDGAGAADIEAHGGVELERVAAGGGLGVTEHHADLHADLVDEDHQRVGALDVGGELSERLRHQAGVQAHVRVAHLAFDFGL